MDGEITSGELEALLEESDAVASAKSRPPGTDEGGHSDSTAGDDLRIVDIRNPGAFRRGRIPGSENIPAPELTARVEELDGAGRVVTVCPHGKASVQAARLVASYEGVEGPVESLDGGLEGWDGPLVSEDAASAAGASAGDEEPPAPF